MATRQRKRTYGELSEQEILKLVLDGRLVVDVERAVVTTAKRPDRPLRTAPCHRGYRHLRIYVGHRRRSIALHKLVWMAANRQLVPEGHIIHHGDKGKHANGTDNLLLKDHCEHGWYHAWRASAEHRKRFPTFDDFREWKKKQPVPDFYDEFE